MSIALKIKKLREEKGYSQEYMASQLGISQSTYCIMEKNDRMVNFQNINEIASILETEVVEIINVDIIVSEFNDR